MAAYRRGGGRNCAVRSCNNNQRKLSRWRQEPCEEHPPLTHRDCPCLEPFSFHQFPSGEEKQAAWCRALGRDGLVPGKGTVVCSRHFPEGGPTEENPAPLLHLGGGGTTGGSARKRSARGGGAEEEPGTSRDGAGRLKQQPRPAGTAAALPRFSLGEKESRFPQGSWEQATVEAIMKLRDVQRPSSEQIAQTVIACLKDENDYLRDRSRQLEAKLQRTREELDRLKRECGCWKRSQGSAGPQEPPQEGTVVVVVEEEEAEEAAAESHFLPAGAPGTDVSFLLVSEEQVTTGIAIANHATDPPTLPASTT
ncbi:uncharacterized protein SI:CH211-113P18.3 [Latimeria chalumnae]|uniref:uncharacterized protein SI:CH211-113P18.3 n=1 Tax=Latimeria chalumnae TaxID=7897 RepID=UPI0006D93C4F|nr:PREDICTED: uncharacterized protein LOC106706917 [Latimeria chalumnae]|eukprot:XP_014353998.1 PREDICTED: uncharacterized protein LOC106706917 [Latimeria chalumnae]